MACTMRPHACDDRPCHEPELCAPAAAAAACGHLTALPTRPCPSSRATAVGLATPLRSAEADAVVREFHEALARSSDMAVAVAAITALT